MIDSSPPPSSAESSFRELDEVFLQTQTRIWLGEFLNTRLDEDLPLPDLLQDGEILFEVSKLLWDLLMTKCMELRHLKHKYSPFGSKKSSGRYRPYSNVDSFLKICKILGLSGIDLFSPSDVVEKRNIRKVCICIRALSKKASSKHLNAPDFDMVIYSVTMPTDTVGVIRRRLESPQCTFSSSSSYNSSNASKLKLKQKDFYAPSNGDDSSSSDESDEAESRYVGENLLESGVKCQFTEESKSASSCCIVSEKKAYHDMNGDGDNIKFILENDDSLFMGDSSCIDVEENNYIADYLAFSDLMVHGTEGSSNSVALDGEHMFDFFRNVDPQGVTRSDKSFHNGSQRIYSDDEDVEVSSTTSMSSVLGRLLNLELDNQFDDDDSSSTNVHSSLSKFYADSDESALSEPSKEEIVHCQLFDSHKTEFKAATTVLSSEDESCRVANDNLERPLSSADEKGKKNSQKHKRRPLLKTVVKSTAIAGIIFLLLQKRKSNGSILQERRQNSETSTKLSSNGKQQRKSGGTGIYPAHKIKLGN